MRLQIVLSHILFPKIRNNHLKLPLKPRPSISGTYLPRSRAAISYPRVVGGVETGNGQLAVAIPWAVDGGV